MNREAFLQRVRQAAEQGCAYRVTTRELPSDIGYVGVAGDPCEALAAEIVAVGGEAHLVDSRSEARDTVVKLCLEGNARTALSWKHDVLERLDLRPSLLRAGIEPMDYDFLAVLAEPDRRSAVLSAGVGITSCDFALAETGSLVMFAGPGQERMASLLPPLHIAVVERSQILPDLYDAIARLHELGFDALPSNAVLITGPSKTGDMELELTTGVHGPGRWCVVIVR